MSRTELHILQVLSLMGIYTLTDIWDNPWYVQILTVGLMAAYGCLTFYVGKTSKE